MPLWSRLDLGDVAKVPPLPKLEKVERPRHDWIRMSRHWQCATCLRTRKQLPLGKDLMSVANACAGTCAINAKATAELGYHCLAFQCSDGSALAICLHCKRHSLGSRVAKLLQPCGRPIASAAGVMKALKQGKHPNPRFQQRNLRVDLSEVPDIQELDDH